MKRSKKFPALLLAGILMLPSSVSALASVGLSQEMIIQQDNDLHPDSEIHNINLDISNKKIEIPKNQARDIVANYTYWSVTSKTKFSTKLGAYRIGPTGIGPGNLSINSDTGTDRSFTATISGEFPMGAATIGGDLGVSIGKSDTYGTSYSIDIPSGERRTIIFRPKIDVYKVVQTQYQYNYSTNQTSIINTKVAYVDVFNNWDYGWRTGY